MIVSRVVVLPAPFGPRKQKISPASTVMLSSETAWIGPKLLVRLSILIDGASIISRLQMGESTKGEERDDDSECHTKAGRDDQGPDE